jgi:hydroxymethylpyrimidine pyrophosphatase-like HAD family hydrolase
MAIGDNFNDLDMLEFAGVPVVMGNASEGFQQDTVTRRGWAVTRDCDSHGVAHAVREWVL